MRFENVKYGRYWMRVYLQDWEMECGPTSIATLAYRLKGVTPSQDFLRKRTKRPLVSPGILGRIQALQVNVGGNFRSRDIGTYHSDLVGIARAAGLQAKAEQITPFDLLDRLKTANRSRGFVVHMRWRNGGGGHFVAVPMVVGNTVVVLDPYFGLQTTGMCPWYRPTDNLGTQYRGDFTGYIVEVSTT